MNFIDLRNEINLCNNCPMRGKQVKTLFSPFEVCGDPNNLEVIFVGEAPGQKEAEKGRPFHPEAKAGSVLRSAIDDLGLKNYAIINIVCCFPTTSDGRTRTPEDDERQYCKAHALKFLSEHKAPITVLLGGTAAFTLLPDSYTGGTTTTITQLTQKEPCIINEEKYAVAYHPSYIHRNGGVKSSLYKSWIIRLKDLIKGRQKSIVSKSMESKWFEIRPVTELEDVLSQFEKYNDIGQDYETSLLETWSPTNRILGFSLVALNPLKAVYLYWPSEDYVLPKNLITLLLNFFRRKRPWTYNVKFEMGVTWFNFGEMIDFNDSYTLCLVDCSPGSLKENARKYLDADYWEDFIVQARKHFNTIFNLLPKMEEKHVGEYNLFMTDFNSFITHMDEEAVKKRLDSETNKRVERLEVRLANATKTLKDIYGAIKTLKTMFTDQEIISGLRSKSSMVAVPLEKIAEYCCYDSLYAVKLKERLYPQYSEQYPIYLAQSLLSGVMESYGMTWDDDRAIKLSQYYLAESCLCLKNLIDKLNISDDNKLLASAILGGSKSPEVKLEELKGIFNPLSNKIECQEPFWSVYRTDETTAIITLHYFNTLLSNMNSIKTEDLANIIDKTDVNKTIDNIVIVAKDLIKSNDKQKREDGVKIINEVQKLTKTWDFYFQRFASEILEFHYQAHIRFGGKFRYCCKSCHKWSSNDKQDVCPICGDNHIESGLDIDNKDTWSDEFYILFLLKKFKKILKSFTTYIEGKVGRKNVNLCLCDTLIKPPIRYEYYYDLAEDKRILDKNKKYIFTPSLFACTAATKRWQSGSHTIPPESALKEIHTPRNDDCCILHYDYCWHKDTKIKLLNGEIFTIKELYNKFLNKESLYLYSHNEGQTSNGVVHGTIKTIKKSRYVKKLLEITLDNNYKLYLTHDHKLYDIKLNKNKAKDFKVGDSIFSLYTKNSDLWKNNHKIISIREVDYYDWVYSIEISEDYHNYYVIASEDNTEMILSSNSQNEIRFMAALSGDENLLNAFRQNKDIHTYVASRIYKVPEKEITPKQRRFAKSASFAILYGKDVYSFALDYCNGDIQQAKNIYDGFFSGFPKVAIWIEERHGEVERGYVNTILGDPLYLPISYNRNELKRKSQNWPIQSSASIIAGYGIWELYDRCRRLNIKSIPTLFTHDAAIFELYIPHLFSFIPLMNYVAEDFLWNKFNVPVKIDWEIGLSENKMMKLGDEKREKGIEYTFKCNKSSFGNIVDRLKKFYSVEYVITKEESSLQSMEDLFLPKRAFSEYLGTIQTILKGEIRFNFL